jgi:hypothetical protein
VDSIRTPRVQARLYPDLWELYVEQIPESGALALGDMDWTAYILQAAHEPRSGKSVAKPRSLWSIWEGGETSYLRMNTDYVHHVQGRRRPTPARSARHRMPLLRETRDYLKSDNSSSSTMWGPHPSTSPAGDRAGAFTEHGVPDAQRLASGHKAWPEADLRIVGEAGQSVVSSRATPAS